MTPPINRSWAPAYLVKWFFDQSEFWVTAKGDKVLISKMGDGHAVNTLLMLERVADDIEPLLTTMGESGLPKTQIHIQDTALYEALYRKVMAAVGEAFPPLAEPEIEPWDTEVDVEVPLSDLIGSLFGGPIAQSGGVTSVSTDGEASPEYPWLSEYDSLMGLLKHAIANDYEIIMDYTDRVGRETKDRRVKPQSVSHLRSIQNPFPESRLIASDDDVTKTFYVSRIDRARRA